MAKEKEEDKGDITAEYKELYSDRNSVFRTQSGMEQKHEGNIPLHQIDYLYDIKMDLMVEFGHSKMSLEEILTLKKGNVIKVNKVLGEPVDVLAGEVVVARGEIVIVNERLGIRVTEVMRPQEKSLVITVEK